MRPASQHLVPDSFSYWEPCKLTSIFFKVLLFQIITSVIIWTGFKRAAYQFKLGTGQNNLWKEIFISTEKKTHNFWEVVCLKWSRFLPSTLFSFTANWTQTAGFVTVLNPVIALWNFPSFRVSQFVTGLEPPALTFYNLALFSIYVNDGTTISRSSVIINIKQISLRKGSRSKHVVEN